MENKYHLTLKWGTLKRWNFKGSKKAAKLFEEYNKIGSSYSAMMQRDTVRQKEIICELIDLCEDGTVYLDWDDKYVSNAEAKEYVMNYNR